MGAEFEAWLLSCGGNLDADTIRCMRTAWDAATERAAKIAKESAKRNESCPRECKCGDGYHIAARIRGGQP